MRRVHSHVKNVEERLLVNSKPAFLADAMLGSIARKLRIFGFDTLYVAHTHDDEILKIGIEENRIILTCDKELFKRILKREEAHSVLLQGSDDLKHIVHILSKCGITSLKFHTIDSRCAVCNGFLIRKKPSDVIKDVHSNVLKRHQQFFKCSDCKKIYWEGTHLTHIQQTVKLINENMRKIIQGQFNHSILAEGER
jgi:uncharacterized protein with PIN domain